MIKLENTEVMGLEAAIRGMRNPLNSWQKSDSVFSKHLGDNKLCWVDTFGNELPPCSLPEEVHMDNVTGLLYNIGQNDYDLMKRLRNAGTDHRKFMRMITVYVDITAPLYWWKEFDTYKVGTVANSCSTMHKIADREFTLEDFSIEHLMSLTDYEEAPCLEDDFPVFEEKDGELLFWTPTDILIHTISGLNFYRQRYLKTKDKKYWWQMIQLLPSSYNQRRTVMLNYEVLANMYKSRKNHKLDEWKDLCAWVKTLPYSELITGEFNET